MIVCCWFKKLGRKKDGSTTVIRENRRVKKDIFRKGKCVTYAKQRDFIREKGAFKGGWGVEECASCKRQETGGECFTFKGIMFYFLRHWEPGLREGR